MLGKHYKGITCGLIMAMEIGKGKEAINNI